MPFRNLSRVETKQYETSSGGTGALPQGLNEDELLHQDNYPKAVLSQPGGGVEQGRQGSESDSQTCAMVPPLGPRKALFVQFCVRCEIPLRGCWVITTCIVRLHTGAMTSLLNSDGRERWKSNTGMTAPVEEEHSRI